MFCLGSGASHSSVLENIQILGNFSESPQLDVLLDVANAATSGACLLEQFTLVNCKIVAEVPELQ